MAPQKKKVIAFKSTHTISDDDDEEDDEEFFLLVKNVRRNTTRPSLTIEEGGKEKKTRRSYASIAGSRATWFRIVRRPKVNI